MSAPSPGEAAYSSYVDKWLAAQPEARLLRIFIPAARAPAFEAHACLEHELLDAACAARGVEPGLAKLAWWHDELGRACGGSARHPVALRLHQLGTLLPGRERDASALVVAARDIATNESPADVAALLAPFGRFADAALALCTGASVREDTRDAAAAARLAHSLRDWAQFALPQRARVPLSLLARAGVLREDLVRNSAEAATVLDSLAEALQTLLTPASKAPATDPAIIAAIHVVRAMRRNPRACVSHPPVVRSLPLLLDLWRHARRESRVPWSG